MLDYLLWFKMERRRKGKGEEKGKGNQAARRTGRGWEEDEVEEMTPAYDQSRTMSTDRTRDLSMDMMALALCEGLQGQRNSGVGIAIAPVMKGDKDSDTGLCNTSGERPEGRTEMPEKQPERDGDPRTTPPSVSLSFSPVDSWASSISNLSSPSPTIHRAPSFSSSSSSSPVLSLAPPLPPSVELSAVLAETRLTLDVYRGGAAVLPILWGSIPGQLRGLQYLRLGSEDEAALEGALEVLPHLTQLRSLAIRGTPTCVSELLVHDLDYFHVLNNVSLGSPLLV